MVQLINKYKMGDNLHFSARINGKLVAMSLNDLKDKAREFKQKMAQEMAKQILKEAA